MATSRDLQAIIQQESLQQSQQPQIEQSSTMYESGHYKDKVILASGGYDHSIRFWNAEKGYCERIIHHNDNSHQVNAMAITPNREILASAGFQHIRLYDIDSGSNTPLINFEGISKNVTVIGFNPNGKWFYTGGEDGYMRIWDVRHRTLHCQRNRQFQTPITSAFLHPNGAELYVADQSGSIYIWNLQTDEIQRLFVTNESFINSIAYDKDCRLLAALDTKGNCFIYKVSHYVPRSTPATLEEKVVGEMTMSGFIHPRIMFPAHFKYGLKCAFSPDSTLLATASADTTVRFWRTSDLTIAKPTSVIKFNDPFESITNAATGPASAAGLTSSRTPIYKNAYSEEESSFMGNSSQAFLESPFLAGLFAGSVQPPKPPPCYMKPKRTKENCPVCTGKIQLNAEESPTDASSGSLSNSRSMYHSSSCTSQNQSTSFMPHMTSLIPLQPNLNSFSQLSWNFYGPKSLNPPGRESLGGSFNSCNHFSHFQSKSSYRSKLSNDNPSEDSPSSGSSHGGHKHSHPHHPNHSHEHLNPNVAGQLPAYYAKYFDNKFYQLYSRPDDSEDPVNAAKEDVAEDAEFFKILKKMKLLDLDTTKKVDEFLENTEYESQTDKDTESDQDEIDESTTAGVRKRTKSKSKIIEYCCCTCCEICNDADDPTDDSDEPDGRTRNKSGSSQSSNGLTGLPVLGKNEWNFSASLTPWNTLGYPTQRWVWDIQFSADSQYIFTASSDQVVRLWSVFTGQLTREYNGHQKAVTALAFSDLI